MSQISQFLQDLAKHSDAIKQCARPLRHLGVTCFYYFSIKKNGEHSLLTDCPHVDEYYYENKIYLKDPYLRHPDNYNDGFFSFKDNKKKEFDNSLAYLENTFQISPLIGICKKNDAGAEFFGFWGEPNKSPDIAYIYLYYTHLLQKFINYFKKECASVFQKDSLPCLSIEKLIGLEAFQTLSTPIQDINSLSIRNYLAEIGMGNEIMQTDSLSPRERECMRLLVYGKSSKEIAAVLDLSSRTVEHYLDNIKNKLGCHYKNELCNKSEKLIKLGLI
jgi:DNA-binding CsgD family transcriptional regulator